MNSNTNYTISNNLLGSGVDGFVYEGYMDNEKIAVKIINKNIFENDEFIQNFIKMNMLASSLEIGPKIYSIISEKDKILIYMDLMDKTLSDYINKKLETESYENVEESVKSIVFPIHKKMYDNNISIGDDNVENYMEKNGKWYRIDFTQNKFIKSKKADYLKFSYFNIKNISIHRIFVKDL